ncbi:PucR family transcriptional regulator [Nostocoides vanveenii]|jgi:purine catabolism regulator|uniref:PucR family transcriptional regulator n=1 Tax=Nostocoides vanveenii TaxID=330835 RepID=A0ABN2KGY5_9MICO
MVNVANDRTGSGLDLLGTTMTPGELPPQIPDTLAEPELRALAGQLIAALRREDEVHRSLLSIVVAGGSLADLCEALAALMETVVMITTTDGRVIAQAGDSAAIEEAAATSAFDPTGRFLVEHEMVGERSGDADWVRRATVRIIGGSGVEGRIVAFAKDRALSRNDIHLLERSATVAALAIAREQAVTAVESKYRAEFLRDALAGRAGSTAEAIAHADSLGWTLTDRMVVVVAETDENDTFTHRDSEEVRALQQRFARAWIRAVGARDRRVPVMGFSQEIVALLPLPPEMATEKIMAIVTDLARIVRGDGGGGRRTFSTGVSRPITAIESLPMAYAEALRAAAVGRQKHGAGAITHFDELGIYRLLSLVPDSEELRQFVTDALGELATDDSPENADLRLTLAVLIDTNLNVAEASRLLFFHYNTLRYRIAKLERILGPFTTDPQLRLTLALALKVLEMRGLAQSRRSAPHT